MRGSMAWMATASLLAIVLFGADRAGAQPGAWAGNAPGSGYGWTNPGRPPGPVHPGHPPDRVKPHHRHYDYYRPEAEQRQGWFQRPYPYHLDYYRMRYGGSYAPYFGNLYGPPVVVTPPVTYPPIGPHFGGAYYW